ncbi:MAG: FtsX-like permease family protein, partial [Acidobacteria bacterium]|nr:FtsX-like permease family protein [Acidobacteriota bacterium]
TEADRTGSEPVVIVSETLARTYFPGERVVDRRIGMDGERRIVGIVGDVKPDGLDSQPRSEIYFPYGQLPQLLTAGGPLSAMNVVARTDGDPMALVPAIRSTLRNLDSGLPLFNITTLARRVSDSVAQRRLLAALMGIFAGLALVLAAVGIYGVLSYQVAQSTREIGIRIALGAGRGRMLAMVLGQGAMLAVAGIVLGLGAAWGLSRFVSSLLFGITATHPATYVAAAAFMAGVGLLGAYVPARRAMAVDPVIAIRTE